MARGEIPRHDSGLIDFAALRRYYPPDNVGVPFGIFSDSTWKNHHGYFTFELWVPQGIAPENRTPLQQERIEFRSKRQNRLMLLNDDEEKLHAKHGPIDPESIPCETMQASQRDFLVLDELRYAVAGLLASTRDLGSHSYLNESLRQIDPQERIRFFTATRDRALEKLKTPEITPDDVITSLIGRTAQATNDPDLYEVSIERMRLWKKLGKKPNFYPFDVHNFYHSITGARSLLHSAFAAEIEVVRAEETSTQGKYDWDRHPTPATATA